MLINIILNIKYYSKGNKNIKKKLSINQYITGDQLLLNTSHTNYFSSEYA